jgi:glycine/D-amino acid oxidase-like deaminating enzyme
VDDSNPGPNIPLWDDGGWVPHSALAERTSADVCVVGLGGSGLAAVLELLGQGASVVGIDAGIVAGGAAGRNGGFLLAGLASFHHDSAAQLGRERAAELYRLTMDEIERIGVETPQVVRLTGSLRIAATEDEWRDCISQFAAMLEDGLPVEMYDGPEGRGLMIPTDGVYQPLERCRFLARRAVAGGARLFENSAAVRLAGNEVVTPAGRVSCGAVVVAVDGRLECLLPELAPRVRTARLQMLGTAPARSGAFTRPIYTRWGYDYWQQLEDGRVVLGGFRDAAMEEEWTTSDQPTAEIQELEERLLREKLGITAPVTHRWAASVSYSQNDLPVLGEIRPGLWACGAYSGTGNVVGAMCGRAAAQAATGRSPRLLDLLA